GAEGLRQFTDAQALMRLEDAAHQAVAQLVIDPVGAALPIDLLQIEAGKGLTVERCEKSVHAATYPNCRATSASARSVASSVRSISAVVCAALRNIVWVACR